MALYQQQPTAAAAAAARSPGRGQGAGRVDRWRPQPTTRGGGRGPDAAPSRGTTLRARVMPTSGRPRGRAHPCAAGRRRCRSSQPQRPPAAGGASGVSGPVGAHLAARPGSLAPLCAALRSTAAEDATPILALDPRASRLPTCEHQACHLPRAPLHTSCVSGSAPAAPSPWRRSATGHSPEWPRGCTAPAGRGTAACWGPPCWQTPASGRRERWRQHRHGSPGPWPHPRAATRRSGHTSAGAPPSR